MLMAKLMLMLRMIISEVQLFTLSDEYHQGLDDIMNKTAPVLFQKMYHIIKVIRARSQTSPSTVEPKKSTVSKIALPSWIHWDKFGIFNVIGHFLSTAIFDYQEF